MKKTTLFFLALTFIFVNINAQQRVVLGQNYENPNEVTLVAERGVSTTIKFDLNEFNLVKVETDYGTAYVPASGKAPLMIQKGSPELFYLTTSFIIPDKGASELEITYGEYQDLENIEIAPSKGHLLRTIDPNTVPYVKNDIYEKDGFFPGTVANLREPFIMRDIRGQSVDVFPIQYNPVTKVLRIYSEITVTVINTKKAGINELTNQKRNKSIDPAFNQMYGNMFINHSNVSGQRNFPTSEAGELLIICHPAFMDAMKPYIDWKRTIGRNTTMVSTAATGTTATNIKSYILTYYNNPENNLAYVLFVGDNPQIPVHTVSVGDGTTRSDVFYGQLVGTDPYLEVLIGRMSAETVAQVETQVQRSIWYERDLTTANTWLNVGWGGSHRECGGHFSECDDQHIELIRGRKLDYGYTTVHQAYTGVSGITNATLASISQNFNEGVGVAHYCNHGSKTAWTYKSGLTYSNTQVNALTNQGKLPFIYSVACVNGEFHTTDGDCFAEAWMRATQSGQPTGAVAFFGSTRNLWWAPPMEAQDIFANITMDLPPPYGHTVQPGVNRTIAGAMLNSSQMMMMVLGASGEPRQDYEGWLVFGDPTLMYRTKTPQAVTVSHNPVLYFGWNEFAVNCDAEGATVTMSYKDEEDKVVILGSAVVNGGIANITFEPISMPVEVTICVTGFNLVTNISNVLATPAEGPYIVPGGYTVVDGEALTYISTNEEIEVILKNVGIEATNALNVTISCDDPQLTINQPTATCGSIAPDGTATATFKVTVANDIYNNQAFPIEITVSEDGKARSWEGKLTLKALAPQFAIDKVLVNGVENGKLTPGALATITTVVINKGGADAYAVMGDFETNSNYVTLVCAEQINPIKQHLPSGETMELAFNAIVSPNISGQSEESFDLLLAAQYGLEFSTPFTVTAATSGSGTYCSSGNQNAGEDNFTSVQILKGTTILLSNTNGSNGYEDFTNMIIPLEPGEQYIIKIKCGFSSQTVKGWFDFNGNNTFDTHEQLISMNGNTNETTATFTIPAENIVPGTHRLRLVTKYNGTPSACNNSSYGQTHDYTFTLPEMYARVQNVTAELQDENITVTWEAPAEEMPIGYNIYRENNKLNTTLLNVLTFTEENITEEGIYAYFVTAVYEGNQESHAEMSVVCNFLLKLCEAPINLSVTQNNHAAVLTWNEPENINDELLGYNIYRDDIVIKETASTVREYIDEEVEIENTYVYKVSARYAYCVESELTEGKSLTVVGINEITTDVFRLFPNPAKNEINITGTVTPTYVGIYNLTGQLMYETAQCTTNMKISVSSLTSGIYFVRIVSEKGITTKKVVVD